MRGLQLKSHLRPNYFIFMNKVQKFHNVLILILPSQRVTFLLGDILNMQTYSNEV